MNEQLEKVAEALRKRGFKAVCCATGAEAHDYVMQEAEGVKSVGFGGSVTVKSLGLVEAMAAGKEILRHGDPSLTPEQKVEVMHRELTSTSTATATAWRRRSTVRGRSCSWWGATSSWTAASTRPWRGSSAARARRTAAA